MRANCVMLLRVTFFSHVTELDPHFAVQPVLPPSHHSTSFVGETGLNENLQGRSSVGPLRLFTTLKNLCSFEMHHEKVRLTSLVFDAGAVKPWLWTLPLYLSLFLLRTTRLAD